MNTLAIGGNSRSVGKTSLAVSIIGATREADWTAVKLTLFGHGICSRSGDPCSCAVTNPACPYEISVEDGLIRTTDTARMLAAGAAEVLWVRVAMGQLPIALPAIRQRLAGKRHVLFESNSIVEHLRPDAYLSVLRFDTPDCKESAGRLAPAADAFVLAPSKLQVPAWADFDPEILKSKPAFKAGPPSYCTSEIIEFVRRRVLRASRSDSTGWRRVQ